MSTMNVEETHTPPPFELAARQFEIGLRRLADDLTYGMENSRYVGSGIDFAQTRPYMPGDSVRSIDWKVTARTRRVHVKDYEAPKRACVFIIVDTSASMAVSSTGLTKQAAAVWAAGALAMVAYRRRNPVALLSGGDRGHFPPPSLLSSALYRSIEQLRHERPREKTGIVEALSRVRRAAQRSSLVVVVSDLHEDNATDEIISVAQRHDCMVIRPIDPAELRPLRAGFVRICEAEGDGTFIGGGGAGLLTEEALSRPLRLAEGAVAHVELCTDQPLVAPLRRALNGRAGRRLAR
ncbi:MAG: DUF58 domain-containing protein [Phycisphaerales bacterium]